MSHGRDLMAKSNFAQPFYWKKKGCWAVYRYDNGTYYKLEPMRIPNNSRKSKFYSKKRK